MGSDVVVVGAGGTLGGLLLQKIDAIGVEVRASSPREPPTVASVDLANVVVCAAGPRVRSGLGWYDYFREHVGLTTAVVRSMRPGSHLVYFSSAAVYGSGRGKIDSSTHEAPLTFPSPAYASAKLAAEFAARTVAFERRITCTVLRPSIVYGPGVSSALMTLRRVARRGVRLLLRPPDVKQHLLHIDLLVHMVRRAVELKSNASGVFVAADPFVLTHRDLWRLPGQGISLGLSVNKAVALHSAWRRVLGSMPPPAAFDALAVFGLDNEYDALPAFERLGIDPSDYSRERMFDRYWDAL
jgi:nucleoside-diphosphate-sugar epimerase